MTRDPRIDAQHCPKCPAHAGHPCVDEHGVALPNRHYGRVWLAMLAIVTAPPKVEK